MQRAYFAAIWTVFESFPESETVSVVFPAGIPEGIATAI